MPLSLTHAGLQRSRRGAGRALVLAVVVVCAFQGFPWQSPSAVGHSPAPAQVPTPADETPPSFISKVSAAAAQGATAAAVAAVLSAVTEPMVNRLLVQRKTFSQAMSEVNFKLVSGFFLTTLPTNMLKFPVFEVINMALSFTSLSGSIRGIVNGWLFCTIMLPVTNYRFRKSMGWEINPALLYQAYVPTVARDIIYGWARGLVGGWLASAIQPETFSAKSGVFGLTIFFACIISSPGNEWRGYTLQPKDRKLPFKEYFKPVNYARSTGVGATIMGIALMVGMLITPYVEHLVGSLSSLLH
mmetsp:Transcript_26373/g.73721  ORF Transcript_26373/g.73721 Transcript_26373/m.73721 type:complete len:300 (-) Transcript_26373:242-1141(-)